MSLSTQSVLHHLAIVSLRSYLSSLALPELASKHTLDTLAARRALPSHTISPSHFRKNSRFQTSAPVLLKRSLSFSLQLFRKIIYHTQTLTFGMIAALGAHIAVPVLSSGCTKRLLGIASPVRSSTYLSGRNCVYVNRALYTELPMYFISIQTPEP